VARIWREAGDQHSHHTHVRAHTIKSKITSSIITHIPAPTIILSSSSTPRHHHRSIDQSIEYHRCGSHYDRTIHYLHRRDRCPMPPPGELVAKKMVVRQPGTIVGVRCVLGISLGLFVFVIS